MNSSSSSNKTIDDLNKTINDLNKTIDDLYKTIEEKDNVIHDFSLAFGNLFGKYTRLNQLIKRYNEMKELDDERKEEEREEQVLAAKQAATQATTKAATRQAKSKKKESIRETTYNPINQAFIYDVVNKSIKEEVDKSSSSKGGKTNKKIKSKRRHTKKRF